LNSGGVAENFPPFPPVPRIGDGRRGETIALAPAADGIVTIDFLSAPTHWRLVEPRP